MRATLAIALWCACGSPAVVVERRTVIRVIVERCLVQPPPEPPSLAGDKDIDEARQLDAYDPLAVWAYLYAWPSCKPSE